MSSYWVPFMCCAICMLIGVIIGRDNRRQNTKVGTPSASHNTGSLPLCRSCIKLYACCQAGDVMQACASHQTYAAQQQASA
jgi:hypothetical protein